MGEYLLLIAILLALFTNCLTAETQQKTPPITGPEDPHLPQIIVTSQPDSPLQVTTLTKWAIPTREMLDLYVTVKNQDAKSVRAYTTRIDVDQQGRKEICLIENIYFPDKVIKQDGGIGRSRFLRVEKNIPPPSIEVSIDYVESLTVGLGPGSLSGSGISGRRTCGRRGGHQVVSESHKGERHAGGRGNN